jgi:hypothetical protein
VVESRGDWWIFGRLVGTSEVERRRLTSSAALGHHYEERNQHYLAAPLFLQALAMSPTNSCHTTVLSKLTQPSYKNDSKLLRSEQSLDLSCTTKSPTYPWTTRHIKVWPCQQCPSMGREINCHRSKDRAS